MGAAHSPRIHKRHPEAADRRHSSKRRALKLERSLLELESMQPETIMTQDRTPPSTRDEETLRPQDDLEQEFYTALRAAGASPEQAQSCLHAEEEASLH